jgi:hypothetical protein
MIRLQDLANRLLQPLAGFDLEILYARYHTGVDLFLYLLLLTRVCRLALARVFPGNAGRDVGTVVGVALAISLSASEHMLGFSIRSFGPIAAGLIVFIVGLTLYSLLRHVGAGHMMCGSIALVVTYLSMRAVMPGFFLWAHQNEWADYLHVLVILATLVALWRIVNAMFGGNSLSLPALTRPGSISAQADRNLVPAVERQDMTEWRLVQKRLRGLTTQGQRDCDRAIQVLAELAALIRTQGQDARVADAVCRKLQELKAGEHVLVKRLARIRDIDVRLQRFEFSQWANLRKRYGQLSPELQAECRRQFNEEREKLAVETAIQGFGEKAEVYARGFAQSVDAACECLRAGRAEDAASHIQAAIDEEQGAKQLIAAMETQERALLRIIDRQVAGLEASKSR